MALIQAEYDYLMAQDKAFEDSVSPIQLGPAPINWTRQINSLVNKEIFMLDFYRGSFELSKYTLNKRYRQTVILLRYDNGGRHTNPDGISFDGSHVHLYREGFGEKFAFPVVEVGVSNTDAMEIVFGKIMQYCNVKKIPTIEVPMF